VICSTFHSISGIASPDLSKPPVINTSRFTSSGHSSQMKAPA
jgi:hypothetical protein